MKIPHISNAFEHIKEACDQEISTLYPIKIPEIVLARYNQELAYLKESEYLDEFEIFRLLSKEAKKSSQFIFLRGTDTGSYITYLLGNSLMNPLPAHYYCPNCGHFETINTSLFGIDLPETACPDCNETMNSDGFNISIESAWGLDGKKSMSFEYNISEEFRPFAKRVLETLYPKNEIVPLGSLNKDSDKQVITIQQSGLLVLPAEQTIHDYTEMQGYLEDGDLCLTGNVWNIRDHNMCRIILLGFNIENNIVIMQRKTFSEMTRLHGCAHATFKYVELSLFDNLWELLKLMKKPEFMEFQCFTRDDIFDTALSLGFDNQEAFKLSELIRKGRASRTPEVLDEFHLPASFHTMARGCLYLFPRAHCASLLLAYALLAYYMKKDSRSFSRLIYKKK